jgi:uncharacterized protein
MTTVIGHVEAIFRYPVKSMAGEPMESARVGWHGIDGDRRLALRRTQAQNGFPWLTASKLAEMILFKPVRNGEGIDADLPTHVRTPEGTELEVFGDELRVELERRHGSPVEMTYIRSGIFDDASISVIATDTIQEIGRLSGASADTRRFRPNVVVRLHESGPFQENAWVGGTLSFGDPVEGPRVSVTMRDTRCMMINLDPDSAQSSPEVLKSVVRNNDKNAGIYGTIIRTGEIAVGQPIRFHPTLD